MKRKLTSLFCAILLLGCAEPKPDTLAKDICECYSEMKATKNTAAKLEKADECFQLTQSKLSQLEDIGKSNDWSDDKVASERSKFEASVAKCNEKSTNDN